MKIARPELSSRYLAALRGHLSRKHRGNGARAQGVGRTALAQGLAIRELAKIHQSAVTALAGLPVVAIHPADAIQRASFFFTQALMPLEIVQSRVRDQNRQLQQRNATLRRHAAELLRGNRRLQQEIADRMRKEAFIRHGEARYEKLLGESHVMQQKLRQLTRQIISVQEEERRQISRELHDEVVQTLVGINVQLAALGHGATAGLRGLKSKIRRTQRLVEKSVSAVHRFARELRPAVLDDLGLIPALHAFSENLAARKRIRIHITAFKGVEALAAAKRTVLFRVAQEALTNVARHAQATEVELTLSRVPRGLRMDVIDNGKSFRVDQVLAAGGRRRLGLTGMRERMEMVGGTLAIQSSVGTGTMIRAELPFTVGKSAL